MPLALPKLLVLKADKMAFENAGKRVASNLGEKVGESGSPGARRGILAFNASRA